jgi:hypothetical protein
MSHDCNGPCRRYRTCEGEVTRVHVTDEVNDYDWGQFWYCGTAITEDRNHGLRVVSTSDRGGKRDAT